MTWNLGKAIALHKGAYMEENGYEWAYPLMAELAEKYHRIKDLTHLHDQIKINKGLTDAE